MANNETRLKATYQSCYPKYNSEKGTVTDVFVYEIKGSPAGLKRYEEVQGDNFRADKETDIPLYFSTSYFGDNGEVKITQNDKVVANTDSTRKMRSAVDNAGSGKLGDAMAQLAAQILLGVQVAPAQQIAEPTVEESSDEQDVQDILDQADEDADLSGEVKKTAKKK
jgi:hypothetical protein